MKAIESAKTEVLLRVKWPISVHAMPTWNQNWQRQKGTAPGRLAPSMDEAPDLLG